MTSTWNDPLHKHPNRWPFQFAFHPTTGTSSAPPPRCQRPINVLNHAMSLNKRKKKEKNSLSENGEKKENYLFLYEKKVYASDQE